MHCPGAINVSPLYALKVKDVFALKSLKANFGLVWAQLRSERAIHPITDGVCSYYNPRAT